MQLFHLGQVILADLPLVREAQFRVQRPCRRPIQLFTAKMIGDHLLHIANLYFSRIQALQSAVDCVFTKGVIDRALKRLKRRRVYDRDLSSLKWRHSYQSLEREMGIEPTTNSLEGCDSTTELLPPTAPLRSKTGADDRDTKTRTWTDDIFYLVATMLRC